jgi:hypothetical protein
MEDGEIEIEIVMLGTIISTSIRLRSHSAD